MSIAALRSAPRRTDQLWADKPADLQENLPHGLFNAQPKLSTYPGNYSAMKPIKVLKCDIGHADLPLIALTNIDRYSVALF